MRLENCVVEPEGDQYTATAVSKLLPVVEIRTFDDVEAVYRYQYVGAMFAHGLGSPVASEPTVVSKYCDNGSHATTWGVSK